MKALQDEDHTLWWCKAQASEGMTKQTLSGEVNFTQKGGAVSTSQEGKRNGQAATRAKDQEGLSPDAGPRELSRWPSRHHQDQRKGGENLLLVRGAWGR